MSLFMSGGRSVSWTWVEWFWLELWKHVRISCIYEGVVSDLEAWNGGGSGLNHEDMGNVKEDGKQNGGSILCKCISI